MFDEITEEDLERLQREYEKNNTGSTDLDYQPLEDYEHLTVSRCGERYNLVHEDTSINIPGNQPDKARLSNFIEKYLECRNFEEAHRLNYKSNSSKAEELKPLLEDTVDLSSDLAKLAKELVSEK